MLIARALCATRELLILDEPITGLDPMAIQDFYSMIRKLNREDKVAIIMVSHDLRNAVEEANKILHLQKQVLFYGPAHDYMNSKAAGHFFHEKEQRECAIWQKMWMVWKTMNRSVPADIPTHTVPRR